METQDKGNDRARVLVVEDDRAIRDLLCEILLEEGYDVATAVDGGQALAVLPEWRPDVILLDLLLPDMDGRPFRAAEAVLEHAADIPTVVMSAAAGREDGSGSLRSAAVFPKPFDIEALISTVQRLTR